MSNTDRHHENWGLVVEQAARTRALAPTFDHASSLGAHENDDNRARRLATKDRRGGDAIAQARTIPNSSHGTLYRLDCYRLAVEFHRLSTDLAPHGSGLGDQLRRAAASIVLNLAEGHARLTRTEQARFTAIARGSALECLAVLDLLAHDSERLEAIIEARKVLVRVIQTTTGLWGKLVA